MKILWLNDSLTLRAENPKEKSALAVVFTALNQESENVDANSECPQIQPNPAICSSVE